MDEQGNPYAAPTSTVGDVEPPISDAILGKIRKAAIAAAVVGAMTGVLIGLSMAGVAQTGFDAWALLDVALAFGLAYGIHRRSRTCAVAMLVYFIASKIILAIELRQVSGLPLALLIGYFLVQGVSGTFAYHRTRRDLARYGVGPQ